MCGVTAEPTTIKQNNKRNHSRTLGSDDFLQVDNVLVVKSLEDFHLTESSNGKPILLLFRVNSLQSHNLIGFSVLTHEHAPAFVFKITVQYKTCFVAWVEIRSIKENVSVKLELVQCSARQAHQQQMNEYVPVGALSDLMLL